MIDLRALNAYRSAEWEAKWVATFGLRIVPAHDAGAFRIPSPVDQGDMRCLVSSSRLGGPPWSHVSVSREDRCPHWEEMDYLARLFYRPTEVVLQFHVPSSDHVNYHPFCLHLWGYDGLKEIPRPPSSMVGPDSAKGRGR